MQGNRAEDAKALVQLLGPSGRQPYQPFNISCTVFLGATLLSESLKLQATCSRQWKRLTGTT